MPTDDAIADLRVLVASVGGDVKAVLAKLDDQNRRIETAEKRLDAHQASLDNIKGTIYRWTGAGALLSFLISTGFIIVRFH